MRASREEDEEHPQHEPETEAARGVVAPCQVDACPSRRSDQLTALLSGQRLVRPATEIMEGRTKMEKMYTALKRARAAALTAKIRVELETCCVCWPMSSRKITTTTPPTETPAVAVYTTCERPTMEMPMRTPTQGTGYDSSVGEVQGRTTHRACLSLSR